MDAWRERILTVAKTWLLTPWRHNARVKGAGADCGQYIIATYVEAELVEDFATGTYPQDWALHQTEERYLAWVEKYCDRIEGPPLPGDIVAWRYGKCFSHGGIVVDWPLVLHAYMREGNVCYGEADKGDLAREHLPDGGSRPRETRFYSIAGRL